MLVGTKKTVADLKEAIIGGRRGGCNHFPRRVGEIGELSAKNRVFPRLLFPILR
jgi:hypothetical protein